MQFVLVVVVLTLAEIVILSGNFPQDVLTDLLLKSWDFLEKGGELLKKLSTVFYN